ncbi:MAG: transcriptional regulator [Alphaproteobacteria bacterium]
MTAIRPIKTEADYDHALERISALMEADDHAASDELDVITTLVEVYEETRHPIPRPDPIDAILFRMEQQNLTRTDLKAYIGSSAKVSEVLARKRPLTLKMIRALNAHLGIPAEVLIGEPTASLPDDLEDVSWDRFPVVQMAKLNWIKNSRDLKDRAEEVMRKLIRQAGGPNALSVALYRKNNSVRRNARMDPYALQAWCLHVLAEARSRGLEDKYEDGTIDEAFLREVARLSVFTNGPQLAVEFLAQHGIALVYAQHLPKTYLDGAAMRTKEGVPVVGVTVRYDRIDNFWFCLLHELAHLGWHLHDDTDYIIDDLSLDKTDHDEDWDKEDEADALAQGALIPEDLWAELETNRDASPIKIMGLAQEAAVHPAIVAGRVRKETGNYRLLSQFVGNGEVRKHFEEA